MSTFPSIKPSARSYSPGQLPVRSYRTLSGAIWKRSFSNTRQGHGLSLEFQNITDAEVEQIVAHYEDRGGSFYRFSLPAALFAGMSSGLIGRLQAPANIQWAYAGEPKISSVFPGRSTVSVELIGEVAYP
jgi:hypothetical protein